MTGHHWTDPRTRGLYDHPAALPPRPSHRAANNLGERLARVETHLEWGARDRFRIEQEARERARDVALALTTLAQEMQPVREFVATFRSALAMMQILSAWVLALAKFGGAALIIWLALAGKLSLEQAQSIGGWLGLPR